MRRRAVATGAALVAALLAGCASGPPAPSFSRASNIDPAPLSDSDAMARLLQMEDRRRFDEPLLESSGMSPEARVRRAAAQAAGAVGDARALPILERLLHDGEPEVREWAAFGAGLCPAPAAIDAILPALADPVPAVASAAALAVSLRGGDAGRDALIAVLGVSAAKPAVLAALARFPTEAAAAAARAWSASPDVDVRRAAIYACSRNPLASSRDLLVAALADPDADTAAFAARGLGRIAASESLSALATALERREPGVLVQIMFSIEQIEEKAPTPLPPGRVARIVALAGDAHPGVALAALFALRRFLDDRGAFHVVNAQAAGGNGRRREIALQSEVAGLKEKALPRLDAALASPDASLRAAAASCLVELKEEDAAPRRRTLSTDGIAAVREAAVDSIPADAEHRVELEGAASDADAGVRSAAVDRLAILDDPAILPAVSAALDRSGGDSIAEAAISVVHAAARFRGDDARGILERALRHPRPGVRAAARRSLIDRFGIDPSSLPEEGYETGRTLDDYREILRDSEKPWRAELRTSRGAISIELDAGTAPLTVRNFVDLARRKYFDGTPIHRVVPNFVVQAGDPTGTGHGDPGFEIRDELSPLRYSRGVVGMALSGPDTGGSQFFIALSPVPHLDGGYTIFGRVSGGREVAERIEQGDRLLAVTIVEGP